MVFLKDFAESRGLNPNTLRKYIHRHSLEFETHIGFNGKKMELDDLAVKLLDEIYPLPKPIEVIEDTESRRKLIQAHELIIQMQNKMIDMQIRLSQADAMKILLDDKEQQLKEKNKQLEESVNELAKKEIVIAEKKARINELETDLNRFEKSFFGFFRKK